MRACVRACVRWARWARVKANDGDDDACACACVRARVCARTMDVVVEEFRAFEVLNARESEGREERVGRVM